MFTVKFAIALALASTMLVSCAAKEPSVGPSLVMEFSTNEFGKLSEPESACITKTSKIPPADLLYFLDSPAKNRSFVMAYSLASTYVRCLGTSPVVSALEKENGSPEPSCTPLVDETLAARVVTSVLIADPVRLALASSPYVECRTRVDLGKSLSGRIFLAVSGTGLSQVVSQEVAVCAASKVAPGQESGIDGVLAGTVNDEAVDLLSSALVACSDRSILAELMAVSAGAGIECVASRYESYPSEPADVVKAYILQDATMGSAVLNDLKEACPPA